MRTLSILLLVLAAEAAPALDLTDAERLAIDADPEVQALAAHARAAGLDAIADAQLPDPMLALGATAVPLPELDVIDEPMSQFQLGIEQRVPPRSMRSAKARRAESEADALALQAERRALEVRTAVRRSWTETVRLQQLIDLTEQRAELLDRYAEALDAGLQSGRVSQQDLLEGRSRAIRVQRLLADLRARKAEQRAALAERLPGTALPARLPHGELPVRLPGEGTARPDLSGHPAVRAANAQLLTAEAGIDLAEAAFDPGWSWNVGVGRRIGDTPMGAPSETMLNARIAIDLPLFTERRQSKRLEAAHERYRAAAAGPVEVRRTLDARLASALATAEEYAALVDVYGDEVLPPVRAAAEAARDKYRNGSIPLEAVLAAEIEVLDVRNERIQAERELDRARIELAYLGGL
ncbi:TolC family protein [Halomonas denitrificans]|nr:TolC family protein [Halomonas denitrificans]